MFPGIEPVSKLIKILHSDASPPQIAGGVCLGMIIGLTPILNIHNLLVLFLILVVRVNTGSAWISLIGFSILAYALDPVAHIVGLKILQSASLQSFWTELYNTPLMTWTRFNNSVVMGSLVISLALFIPVFAGIYIFVKGYRASFKTMVDKLRVVRLIKSSSAYQWYERVRDYTG